MIDVGLVFRRAGHQAVRVVHDLEPRGDLEAVIAGALRELHTTIGPVEIEIRRQGLVSRIDARPLATVDDIAHVVQHAINRLRARAGE